MITSPITQSPGVQLHCIWCNEKWGSQFQKAWVMRSYPILASARLTDRDFLWAVALTDTLLCYEGHILYMHLCLLSLICFSPVDYYMQALRYNTCNNMWTKWTCYIMKIKFFVLIRVLSPQNHPEFQTELSFLAVQRKESFQLKRERKTEKTERKTERSQSHWGVYSLQNLQSSLTDHRPPFHNDHEFSPLRSLVGLPAPRGAVASSAPSGPRIRLLRHPGPEPLLRLLHLRPWSSPPRPAPGPCRTRTPRRYTVFVKITKPTEACLPRQLKTLPSSTPSWDTSRTYLGMESFDEVVKLCDASTQVSFLQSNKQFLQMRKVAPREGLEASEGDGEFKAEYLVVGNRNPQHACLPDAVPMARGPALTLQHPQRTPLRHHADPTASAGRRPQRKPRRLCIERGSTWRGAFPPIPRDGRSVTLRS